MLKLLFSAIALVISLIAQGATTVPVQLISPTGSTSGQAIISAGPTTPPAWGTPGLAVIAGNSLLGNPSGSSAAAGAISVPACNASGNALQWTSGSGPQCASGFGLTAGNLSQFAATTSAQLRGVISDETGSGSAVFATSPVLVTPNLGTPSAVTLTSATGLPISTGVSGLGTGVATGLASAATGTGGPVLSTSPTITTPTLTGITSGTAVASGNVGQIVTLTAGTAVSMTSGTNANCNSLSFAAGEWLIWGNATFSAATSTVTLNVSAGLSTASAPAAITGLPVSNYPFQAANETNIVALPPYILNLASTTTVYIIGNASFTTSTLTCNGAMQAVRIH